ncbi:MAG: hypothetical protein V1775_17925 [Bacteroidota bacterium]
MGIKKCRRVITAMLFFLAGFLFVVPVMTHAQSVIPDTTRFLIGNQVNVTLEFEAGQGAVVKWPELGDTLSHSIEIIKKNPIDTIRPEGSTKLIFRQVITITSFDTGFIVLPPLVFIVNDNNGIQTELKSEPVLLEVKNIQVDTAKEIKDIKPILQAPYTLQDFLPWLLLAAAVGLLGTLIWFYLRNRKKKKPFFRLPTRPQKPPHTVALERLEELRQEKMWQKGQIKEYYTRLTDILREYFEKRFGVNAAEMTSDEILFAMKDHISEVSVLGDLRKLLTLSDLAKFAKGQPLGAENEISMTYAKTIVMNTAPEPSVNEAIITGSSDKQENRNPVNE